MGDAHAEFFGDGRRSDLLFFSSSAVAAVVAFFSQGLARLIGYYFRITECWSCIGHISVFPFLHFQVEYRPSVIVLESNKQARGTPDAVTPKKKKKRRKKEKKCALQTSSPIS